MYQKFSQSIHFSSPLLPLAFSLARSLSLSLSLSVWAPISIIFNCLSTIFFNFPTTTNLFHAIYLFSLYLLKNIPSNQKPSINSLHMHTNIHLITGLTTFLTVLSFLYLVPIHVALSLEYNNKINKTFY